MFAYHYSHHELNDLFIASFAPPEIPVDSKPGKVKAWLRAINVECEEPLEILGNLLGNFLEKEYYNPNPSGCNPTLDEKILQLQKDKRTVLEKLKEYDLGYQRGGYIIKNELTSTQELQKAGLLSTEELQKRIAKKGLSAVEIEVKRALENIEKDPGGALLFAANLLEASCKAYLDHHSIPYAENARNNLSALWKQVVKKAKIHPEDMKQENLKKSRSR